MILLQDPMPIIIVGVLVVAVLGAILLSTGRGIFLIAMLGVIALTLLGVGVEWLVVTEKERVEASLEATADAMVSNDINAILACCSESAKHTRGEARRAVRYAKFVKVKITKLEIDDINYLTSLPTVTVCLTAVITASDRGGQFSEATRPIFFTLQLRKESDRWLITSHEIERAPAGFGKKPMN